LIWAIRTPIFPDRFTVSEITFVNQSGWIIARSVIRTAGEPLSVRDEILLPWARNGVDLTVQWLDGSVHQGLFLRSLEGIKVPVDLVMTSHQSLSEVSWQHFKAGLDHFTFKTIHWLLIVALVIAFAGPSSFRVLLGMTYGQGVSLILAELGIPGFDLLLLDIFWVLVIVLLSRAALKKEKNGSFLYIFLAMGLLHGLAYSQEISVLELGMDQSLPALFFFNLALDLCSFGLTGLLVLMSYLKPMPKLRKVGAYGCGSLGVALILFLFQENVLAGKDDILGIRPTQSIRRLGSLTLNQQSGQRPTGVRKMTTPVMPYLTIEPYEVRQEILIKARTAVQLLGIQDEGTLSVPVQSLESIKDRILQMALDSNSITIDGQSLSPVLTRADFVTLGAAGVVVLETPRLESLDQGIIGLTLVYSTKTLADKIEVQWNLFPPDGEVVEATTVDPFGGSTSALTSASKSWIWEARLSGYTVPVIEQINVQNPKLPLPSLMLGFLVAVLVGVKIIRGREISNSLILGFSGLALLLYPFARFSANFPLMSQMKPSEELSTNILEGLLTNVYRSFDVRDEDQVYDRLAISVAGQQLSEIYLQNRQSLELENRGGARAQVDEVEVLEVSQVERWENGFKALTVWTVSGSVSHFGHTHYRQNQYQADVIFAPVEGSWKIKKIDVLDEERVL